MRLELFLASCFIASVRAAVPGALSIQSSSIPSPSASSTPTFSSSTPTASPTTRLSFNGNSQLFTCTNATFSWVYSGPSNQRLTIVVTNDGVSQNPEASASPISELIASTIDPSSETYTWPLVNLPPGWYKLDATLPQQSYSVSSPIFYIKSGSTTSCLSNSTSSSTPRSHTDVGAIVGGVLGVIAALILAAVVILYLLYARKQKKTRSGNASASNPYTDDRKRGLNSPFSPTKTWNQLASVDSHMVAAADVHSRQHSIHSSVHKSFTGSVNLPVLDYSRDISRASLNREQERASSSNSVVGVDNVLNTANCSSQPHLDTYAVPEQAHTQDSRRQDKTYATDLDRSNSARSPRKRKPSDSSSLAASTALSLVTAAERASVYASASPSPAPVPLSHADLDALASNKPRKATRKPVPLYDASTDPAPSYPPASPENASPSSLTNADHPLYTDDPFARPTPVLASRSSSGTLNGAHYISRSHSNGGASRELAHKNSFGLEGRQMHYLIPDMPLSQNK